MDKAYTPKLYWTNCVWLMGLLALTWGLGYANFGLFNLPIALAISFTKTILVVLFFMHIKGSSRLLHLTAATGLLWLFLMLLLTSAITIAAGWVAPSR